MSSRSHDVYRSPELADLLRRLIRGEAESELHKVRFERVQPVGRAIDDIEKSLSGGDGTWLTTDPLAQNAWIDRRNVELGYHLKPIVRMLKRWNTEHNSRLGSWHLEVIVATVFRSLGSNYRDAVAKFFDWAQSRLDVEDPDGYGGNLAALLTSTQRSAIKQALESARERASRASQAEASGNHAEAIRLWRIIFGSEFPGYG